MSHHCYGCGCEAEDLRQALTQILVAAQNQRDLSGARPQLLAAITVAEEALEPEPEPEWPGYGGTD